MISMESLKRGQIAHKKQVQDLQTLKHTI